MENAQLNPQSCGLSAALTAAFIWSFYSAGVLFLLVIEVYISGFYGYTDLGNYERKSEFSDFFASLFAVSLGAGLTGWLTATFYNFLSRND